MSWTPEQCRTRLTNAIRDARGNGAALTAFWFKAHQYFADNIDAPSTVQDEATLVAEWDKLHKNGESYYAKESIGGAAAGTG